jgi:hypothetical protein
MSSRFRSSALGPGRVALLPPAAYAVHQLRYELAYGANAGAELRETGHSYLHSVVPWLVMLIALAAGGFLWRVGRAFRRHTTPRAFTLSFAATWALCAAVLVAIFACQETLEGWFAVGHPGGWNAVFGYGGWWALPAAACVGLVLAALFHGARWVTAAVAARASRRPLTWPAIAEVRWDHSRGESALVAPWLGGRSSRGPPFTLRPIRSVLNRTSRVGAAAHADGGHHRYRLSRLRRTLHECKRRRPHGRHEHQWRAARVAACVLLV